MTRPDMIVAVSAYECHPALGSEAGAGWQAVLAASRLAAQVRLFTRPVEAAACAPQLPDNVRAYCVELPGFHHTVLRGGPLVRVHNLLWQHLLARRIAQGKLLDGVDLAHHATYATDWQPAGLITAAKKAGVPSLLGPLGGGPGPAVGALPYYSWRGLVGWAARILYTVPSRRLLAKPSLRDATTVAALNGETARLISRVARRDVTHTSPNFVFPDHERTERLLQSHDSEVKTDGGTGFPYEVVFCGRLNSWKGPRLALRAMSSLGVDYRLTFIGDGPEMANLQAAASRLGLSGRIRFAGSIPRPEALRSIAAADCLLLPTFGDSCPGVIGEAMTLGTPAVALDCAGAPELAAASSCSRVLLVPRHQRRLHLAVAKAVEKAVVRRGRPTDAFTTKTYDERLAALYAATLRQRRLNRC